jgi:hypothetical protein
VKRPAMGIDPVYCEYFSVERWPYGRAETTVTSAGFSIVTIMRAASFIFSSVLPRWMRWIPARAPAELSARNVQHWPAGGMWWGVRREAKEGGAAQDRSRAGMPASTASSRGEAHRRRDGATRSAPSGSRRCGCRCAPRKRAYAVHRAPWAKGWCPSSIFCVGILTQACSASANSHPVTPTF